MPAIRFVRLDAELVAVVEPWFEDADTPPPLEAQRQPSAELRPSASSVSNARSLTGPERRSVRSDHAEFVTRRVLENPRRPLAGGSDRQQGSTGREHLNDHRTSMVNEQIEM